MEEINVEHAITLKATYIVYIVYGLNGILFSKTKTSQKTRKTSSTWDRRRLHTVPCVFGSARQNACVLPSAIRADVAAAAAACAAGCAVRQIVQR